jgi:NTE family protein
MYAECVRPAGQDFPAAVKSSAGARDAIDVRNKDIATFLRGVTMFEEMDSEALADLASQFDVVALPGGRTLFAAGSRPDALYILRSGMLGAYSSNGRSGPQLLGTIGSGEIVGEIGLIAQRPRSSLVRALRDSVVLRLPERAFQQLVAKRPKAMLHALSVAITRLQSGVRETDAMPRTFAVLPHDGSVDAWQFAIDLKRALSAYGHCAVIDAKTGSGKHSSWFTALEAEHRFVLYVGDTHASEWRTLCGRQADCFVLLANTRSSPGVWPDGAKFNAERLLSRPRHLVLMHSGDVVSASAEKWLAFSRGCQHHHVRRSVDIARVARLMIGRGVGLVLSGGGARGFAHLGVVRALREAGRPIDCVGGTSIGAIVGAGIAADWSHEEAVERYRRTFVDGKPLSDYTMPFVAMTRGHRVSRLLKREFGELDIRDLPIPFYAVTNLSKGHENVCRSGPLWLWLRASCAIPGVMPPLLRDGDVFVDGAVLDNFPVGPMHEYRVTDIVGVDIGTENTLHAEIDEDALPSWWKVAYSRFRSPLGRPGILRILLRSGMLNAEVANQQRRSQVTTLMTPPVADIDLLDWSSYEKAMDAGYRYACEVLTR